MGAAAQRGIDNWSIRDICALTRSNLNAISYHFGSKDNLSDELVRAAGNVVFEYRRELLADHQTKPMTGFDFLRCWFRPLFDSLAVPNSKLAIACCFLGQARLSPNPRYIAAMSAHERNLTAVTKAAFARCWPELGSTALNSRFRIVNAAAWDLVSQPHLRESIANSKSPVMKAGKLLDEFARFAAAGMDAD